MLRWMVHRVAELTARAEATAGAPQQDLARKEATELILNVWKHLAEIHRRWTEPEPPSILPLIAELIFGKPPGQAVTPAAEV